MIIAIYAMKMVIIIALLAVFLDMDVYEVLIYLTPAVNPVDLNLGDFSYAA